MKPELTNLFEQACVGVVLTVNKRLASSLVYQFDQLQLQRESKVWQKPNILPLNVWLMHQARLLGLDPFLLSERQHLRFWEEIVEQSVSRDHDLQLLQNAATAKRARDAYNLLLQYGGVPSQYPATEESRIFGAWLQQWKSRSADRGWIVTAALPTLVTQALAENRLAQPASLLLVGFDLIPPDLQGLVDELTRKGCEVSFWDPPDSNNPEISVCRAADPGDEVWRCARWVRGLLLDHPEFRVGIVAPRLDEYRSSLANSLQAELMPATVVTPEVENPANFSLGSSLDQEGPVRVALSLLAIGFRMELPQAGWMLRSPYLGQSVRESSARAVADRDLRRKGQSVLSLPRLIKVLSKQGTIPGFVSSMKALEQWTRESGKKRPGVWAEQFSRLLEKVGWPGERPLGSREYQAVEKLTDLLIQLASLDRISGPVTRATAVALLSRMAQEEEFQIDDQDSNVQVLGLLESAGQAFDALWILGLHDTALPATPQPNPFLPLSLQRDRNMPHADAGRELEFAQKVSARLLMAAPRVVASWPESIEGAECRPSPLLSGLGTSEPPMAQEVDPRRLLGQLVPLESITDHCGPPLPPGRTFSGGTGILKDQALCPFRAFAHHRLRAQGLDVPDIGLDPMTRGTLVHGLLEDFWDKVRSLETLQQMNDVALTRQLQESAEIALSSFEREERLDLQPRQRQLEKERLQRVGRTWLSQEQEREPFTVVEIEKGTQITLGPLSIRARIDRIDQLADGRQVVIDYKTGQPDTNQWYDRRVTEPQLPAYCLNLPEEKIGGALFARVHCRDKESRFYGVLHPDSCWSDAWRKNLDKILKEKEWGDFGDLLQHWSATLHALADEFVQGEARVDPTDLVKACQYCDLLALCRRLEQESGFEGDHD